MPAFNHKKTRIVIAPMRPGDVALLLFLAFFFSMALFTALR